ncbi:WD40-repeat-containing domain protein [Dipodascopsis tothii]|uniref:WD40-repeat-containing domain protein n=1 Tax=Dipodascopsis tothii TaxID=44089 RepID=UPI0034CF7FB9
MVESKIPPVPNPVGAELVTSGEFGHVSPKEHEFKSRRKYPRSLQDNLLRRETAYKRYPSSIIARNFVPNYTVANRMKYHWRTYNGQFSEDGDYFYTASQDCRIRLYKTRQNFPWRVYKTVRAEPSRWTITDVTQSPDSRWLAYSTLLSSVQLTSTAEDVNEIVSIDLRSDQPLRNRLNVKIWSIKFSPDGRQLIAGASDCSITVCDIETKQILLNLEGHSDDVNAVCFGDEAGNILFSGSDDHMVKVWDRRSMRNGQESGKLMGHVEGITYVDSKRDGRYLISNGKDQVMKLWDIRKMYTPDTYSKLDHNDYGSRFDYRRQTFPGIIGFSHPNDCSVMSYYGHRVEKTLIRCHFSPPMASGSQYLYSGSSDGRAHVWNLDGTIARVFEPSAKGMASRDPAQAPGRTRLPRRAIEPACVRDISWHPNLPIIATTLWGATDNDCNAVVMHEWRDPTEIDSDDDFDDRSSLDYEDSDTAGIEFYY